MVQLFIKQDTVIQGKESIIESSRPLIDFIGTETADQTSNLSTLNGSGSLQAPKDSGGWTFAGMIKIRVKNSSNNLVEKWIPSYVPG